MTITLGSLFDGSGGFPLAGCLCGIIPIWASEIEPYPIAVTKSRFRNMKHLGDISNINGAEIEPVDIITFGSPCQDLSIAGKRAGLKHENNGDEETTRSGLFMEAIRIIKEMRCATNGKYPRFALWENVPGAFSSNKGEDFRIVLEELIKISEAKATMPSTPKGGWPYADAYVGDGWSLAYRTFDAQYWGVPQRRRRIYLVADFVGGCAPGILFEREGVRGYFETGKSPWQGITANAEGSIGTDDYQRINNIKNCITLDTTDPNPCKNQGGVAIVQPLVLFEPRSQDGVPRIHGKITPTLNTAQGGQRQPCVALSVYCIQGNCIDRSEKAGCNGKGWREGTSFTLNTIDRPAVVFAVDQGGGKSGANFHFNISPTLACTHGGEPAVVLPQVFRKSSFSGYVEGEFVTLRASGGDLGGGSENLVRFQYIVRRLTPTECARLQGFADNWGIPDYKEDFTDEEYHFWLDVRNTHAVINGRKQKDYTKAQILSWYNKLHSKASEYKMWGNGVALPPTLYCMQGICDALTDV